MNTVKANRPTPKTHSFDMTQGNPLPILLRFSIPLFISNLFQQLYNMIDAVVVGQFVGSNALGAVGSTGYITNIFFGISAGLSAGAGVITAQSFGAKNDTMVRKSIVACVYLVGGSALVMGLLGFSLAPAILKIMDTPAAIYPDALLYLRINCPGILASAAYNTLAGTLRAIGNSRTPLLFLIVASLINLVLDLVFVICFRWSVAGVAFATILAQFFSALACLFYVMKREPYFRIPKPEWRFDKALTKQAVRLGIPFALQSNMISISNLALQRVVNGLGETVVAALTAANRFESFVQLPLSSLHISLGTFAGQNIGAKKPERVTKGLKTGITAGLLFVSVMIPITMLFGSNIISMFTTEADVIAIGAAGIFTSSFFYIPLCFVHTTRGTINGLGDAKFPLLTGIVEVVVRVFLAAPATALFGFRGIWITTGTTWTLAALLGIWRYRYHMKRMGLK